MGNEPVCAVDICLAYWVEQIYNVPYGSNEPCFLSLGRMVRLLGRKKGKNAPRALTRISMYLLYLSAYSMSMLYVWQYIIRRLQGLKSKSITPRQ